MKVVRKGVFETNSSSMHSVSVVGYTPNIVRPSNWDGTVGFGKFDWGHTEHTDFETKLSYCLTYVAVTKVNYWEEDETEVDAKFAEIMSDKRVIKLQEVVRKVMGKPFTLEIVRDSYFPFGYIDHQSLEDGCVVPFMNSSKHGFKKKAKEFLFDQNQKLIISNDNMW